MPIPADYHYIPPEHLDSVCLVPPEAIEGGAERLIMDDLDKVAGMVEKFALQSLTPVAVLTRITQVRP